MVPWLEYTTLFLWLSGINCEVALLINFGRRRLEWKRLFPPKKIREHRRKKWGKELA